MHKTYYTNGAVFALKAGLTQLFVKYHGVLSVMFIGCEVVVIVHLERTYLNMFVLIKVDKNIEVFLLCVFVSMKLFMDIEI